MTGSQQRNLRPVALHSIARFFAAMLWLCLCARPALGEELAAPRVVLLEQGPDPFLERVGAEIEKLGFVLVRTAAGGSLEAAARAEGAAAAIRMLPSRNGVEIWMPDASAGRSLLRQVIVDESPRGPDRDVISLQTAELLRTSLLGERKAEPETNTEPAQVPADEAVPDRPHQEDELQRATSLQLTSGALYSPGGVGATVELGLSLQHFWGQVWGLGVDLAVPVRPGLIRDLEGLAKIGTYFAGIGALARLVPEGRRLFAAAGVGPALMLIHYNGEARAPLRSSSGVQWTGACYLRVDVGARVARWLRLGARALAGSTFQRVAVKFAGNEAGNVGPFFMMALAVAEVPLR